MIDLFSWGGGGGGGVKVLGTAVESNSLKYI